MKHGDKNAKTAKAAGQASGKKSGGQTAVETTKSGKSAGAKEVGQDTRKASEAGKKQQAGPAAKEAVPAKAGAKAAGKTAPIVKEAVPAAAGKRPLQVRDKIDFRPREDGGFTNPLVGNALKRAIKKYPNAFRRLTD
jgi:hypothetical protein